MKQKASPADVPVYLFKQGNNFESQRFFGAHFEGDCVIFRTYAPGAQAVELIGEFNGWQGMPMAREGQGGVFSCRIQGAKPGMLYKYKIRPAAGGEADHCDPYGFWMELRPGSASALWPLGGYRFTDESWMAARSRAFDAPVNIYEMHFGSWKKDEARENGWYRYDEIADSLSLDVGTVKSRISRARKQLRNFLLKSGNFSPLPASKGTEKEG